MAEAERIIGTPETPDAAGDGRAESERTGDGGPRPAAGRTVPPAAPEAGHPEAGHPEPAAGESAPGPDAPAEGAATAPAARGKRRIAVLFTIALVAYLIDLSSKMLVVARLEHHEPIEIIGEWLRFEAIRNAGAAFGFGEAFTVIFTVIAAAVIVVIARLARKLYSLPWAIALGLLLGGALGNLTDRIFRSPGVFEGAVVDFIAPKHFAVFNLADSAIVCGGILIVLLSFRGLDPDGTVHKD
ncbi:MULTISPECIES: signal peptidase II [unclassified Streptomyces]|uniref:signal peptidase II n=1 Tax=unclassified Streptomyces TaxID=2593676 RepID=UPI00137220F8|nr:signal peptidase II [Streptomyces sp. SHP 1-2]MCW5249318.1 signal peptidase II [Streptomyces sp. SHP 1-2]MYU21564.1 signal peptidase II [Streptomyces sp. SID8352]